APDGRGARPESRLRAGPPLGLPLLEPRDGARHGRSDRVAARSAQRAVADVHGPPAPRAGARLRDERAPPARAVPRGPLTPRGRSVLRAARRRPARREPGVPVL